MLLFKKSINNIANTLEGSQPLRFAFNVKPESTNLTLFIKHELLLLVSTHPTYYAYTNEKQCGKGRLRSLGELFLITMYYYPNITFKEFLKIFKPYEKYSGHICTTINRRVYFKNIYPMENADIRDEFGYTIKNWKKAIEKF